MNAGEIIKILRNRHCMTQDELAGHLGINKSSVQKYENGMMPNLKLSTIRKLCYIFQVPSWYFIFPEMFKNEEQIDIKEKQAMALIRSLVLLSDEGRKRLFLYLDDIMLIEKYICNNSENNKQEMQLLKDAWNHYR